MAIPAQLGYVHVAMAKQPTAVGFSLYQSEVPLILPVKSKI